jgi:heme/copper-type cytochrome/quinol oxidase subunit 2
VVFAAIIFFFVKDVSRGTAEPEFKTISEILLTMVPAILVLASGYFIGGALGDYFFKRSSKGRVYIALFGV